MAPIASTSRAVAPAMASSRRQASTVSPTTAASLKKARLPYRGQLSLSPETRRYPASKAAKFASYQQLFQSSELLLFLRIDSLSVKELNRLRADLKAMLNQQRANQSADEPPANLKLTHLRGNLVSPVLSSLPHLPSGMLHQHASGPLAVVTSERLHPPTLAAFLRVFQKHAKEFNKPVEDPSAKKTLGVKKAAPQPRDRLVLRSGIAEQRKELNVQDIQQLSTLPDLKGVQAQIVGMVDATAMQLIRILSQASGAQVAQTLEGFKVGLEEQDKAA